MPDDSFLEFMNPKPPLSIVLSTKNHCDFLSGCMEGVLTQTLGDFEFLIVDDGSTDDTWSRLEHWANQDSRVRLFRREKSIGVINSYNELFRLAKGTLLWSIATDDHCINKDFLRDGFSLMRKKPQAAGFYAAMKVVKMPGEILEKHWTAGTGNRFLNPRQIMKLFWRDSGYPCGPSLILKKNWYEIFNGWHNDLGPQCDCFLNLVAGASSGLGYLSKPSVIHRMWPNNGSYLASQTPEDLVANVARLECRARKTIPAFLNQETKWALWRAEFLQRASNSQHEFKMLLRGYPQKKLRISAIRAWMTKVKKLENIYRNSFYEESLSAGKIRDVPFIPSRIFSRRWRQQQVFRYHFRFFFRFYILLKNSIHNFSG